MWPGSCERSSLVCRHNKEQLIKSAYRLGAWVGGRWSRETATKETARSRLARHRTTRASRRGGVRTRQRRVVASVGWTGPREGRVKGHQSAGRRRCARVQLDWPRTPFSRACSPPASQLPPAAFAQSPSHLYKLARQRSLVAFDRLQRRERPLRATLQRSFACTAALFCASRERASNIDCSPLPAQQRVRRSRQSPARANHVSRRDSARSTTAGTQP